MKSLQSCFLVVLSGIKPGLLLEYFPTHFARSRNHYTFYLSCCIKMAVRQGRTAEEELGLR